MANPEQWIVSLTPQQVADLRSTAARARATGRPFVEVHREDYPLESLRDVIDEVTTQMTTGRGFVLVRGLPVFEMSEAEAEMAYWILGSHIGVPLPQNAAGDVLVHVRDQGLNYKNPEVRGYQTNAKLDYHVDSSDVVALLCRRAAKSGGASRIISSGALHNEMVRRNPELAAELYDLFAFDRRLPIGATGPGFYLSPIFSLHQGRLSARFGESYIESAQRHEDAPRLTPAKRQALELFNEIAASPDLYLDMIFEAGDMQFLNNYVIMHSRTEYQDHEEPDRKRDLIRFWLTLRDYFELAPEFAAGGITPRSAAFS